MDVAKIKASGDAALAQISNALDDLEYSPDQRPVPLLRLAMDYVRDIIAELGQEVGAVAWTDDRGLERLREGKQEMVSGVRLGSDTTALYLSPAHTSEARDALMAWAVKNDVAAGECDPNRRVIPLAALNQYAAMRQEAGSRE